ncbi:hypothetical protein Scep_007096 [Stephania cephalantha]|uniref:E3 ubiquitin protein ligase n=1 Tax=Stephania cephalantha TaxID=152367 RepID=A0AAP0KB84_9MAGN
MGSTEPDRKRRHFSSISPTAAAAAAAAATTKRHPLLPTSEEKKLDTAVLQYKNQKLLQQLEVQKVEYITLENKLYQLKEKQHASNDTTTVVNQSWIKFVDELESCSIHLQKDIGQDAKHSSKLEGELVGASAGVDSKQALNEVDSGQLVGVDSKQAVNEVDSGQLVGASAVHGVDSKQAVNGIDIGHTLDNSGSGRSEICDPQSSPVFLSQHSVGRISSDCWA